MAVICKTHWFLVGSYCYRFTFSHLDHLNGINYCTVWNDTYFQKQEFQIPYKTMIMSFKNIDKDMLICREEPQILDQIWHTAQRAVAQAPLGGTARLGSRQADPKVIAGKRSDRRRRTEHAVVIVAKPCNVVDAQRLSRLGGEHPEREPVSRSRDFNANAPARDVRD